MPINFSPGLNAQAGVPITATDANDAASGTRTALAPLFATYPVDANGNATGTAANPTPVSSTSTQAPSTSAGNSLTPVTATAAFSVVVKNSAGNFYGGSITAGATAGLLIAYNSTTAPASGAALTQNLILGVVSVAANGSAAIGDYFIPDRFSAGVTLLFSTALDAFTQPANAAQFIRGRAA